VSNSTAATLDAGSTSTADPYLSYTVTSEGDYYVRVRHESNATNADYGGDYDLWLSISSPITTPTTLAASFDYTLSDAGETDLAKAEVFGISGSTITGGSEDEILYGSGNADTLVGNAGKDVLLGNAGADTLLGGSGDDRLEGGSGNDTLDGGAGNDILYGGAGNDALTGGLGVDVFAWTLADKGVAGTPSVDTISDFNAVDKLDLRDLLQGEVTAGANANLENFLHFEKIGSDTILHISSSGGFSGDMHGTGAAYSSGNEDQRIVFAGVDLIGTNTTDQQVIQNLLINQKLITD
jgi:Ca2+-binding RTX toxin-like protein